MGDSATIPQLVLKWFIPNASPIIMGYAPKQMPYISPVVIEVIQSKEEDEMTRPKNCENTQMTPAASKIQSLCACMRPTRKSVTNPLSNLPEKLLSEMIPTWKDCPLWTIARNFSMSSCVLEGRVDI